MREKAIFEGDGAPLNRALTRLEQELQANRSLAKELLANISFALATGRRYCRAQRDRTRLCPSTGGVLVSRAICLVVVSASAVILVTGCGSSSTHTTNPAADQRIATDAQLKLSDFPSGWEQKGNTEESKNETGCEGVAAAQASATAKKTSPDFEHSNELAESSAYMYSDMSGATQAFSQLSSQSTRTCLADALVKGVTSEATIGKITSGQVSIPPLGDERAAARVAIPASAEGKTVTAYLEPVFVRTGRAVATLMLLNFATPFDTTLRDKLATTVVDRLDAGLKQTS